jgi:hypothetical protein
MRVKEADLRKMRSGIFSARNLHDPNYAELAGEIRFLRAGYFSSEIAHPKRLPSAVVTIRRTMKSPPNNPQPDNAPATRPPPASLHPTVVLVSVLTNVSLRGKGFMAQEIDVRAQGILKGLGELQALLEEPITRHALELKKDARTAHQHDILNRTHRSLTQYLTLEGDLFYIGLLGHFSTGKSSTINSVLNTWGSDDERPTAQRPTDDTISLITRPPNEKYLWG